MRALFRVFVLSLLTVASPALAIAQAQAPPKDAPAATVPADPLGRSTPRGTVVGFLNAARGGESVLARQYLNTTANAEQADLLARQLFVVLDVRLPARLAAISDAPEGSRRNPLMPNQELIATISTAQGALDISVERVERGSGTPVWLFSRVTLAAVPAVYDELLQLSEATALQRVLKRVRFWNSRLFDWVVVLLAILVFYFATVLPNRIVTPLAGRVFGRIVGRRPHHWTDGALPLPARLLLMSIAARWLLANLALSFVVRQFWTSAASVVTIVAGVWLLILVNGGIETYVQLRLPRANMPAAGSLVRLLRRGADALVIFIGLLATLRLFAVDATPALAGLGVGGIAVALAAQKTLENVIAGASLIFDQAVRVGDTLKMGEFTGTVDHIGLRSTRLRTMERTIVSIPNGQLANANLETLSARDKFWFRHVVGLRYETTAADLHSLLEGLRVLLKRDRCIDPTSVRVRFFRLGTSSLDIEVVAYVLAADWNQFLELQEDLLFGVMETIAHAGVQVAFPPQTMYASQGGPQRSRI
jgi:MscS family membrane protein